MDYNTTIFVFGSNLAGLHGAGAARFAEQYKGAVRYVAVGHTGQSYAIPTKNRTITGTLDLDEIKVYVNDFIHYARVNPALEFQVTRIGCGLAGLKDEQVAPLFKDAPPNCWFDDYWKPYLGNGFKYWGHK